MIMQKSAEHWSGRVGFILANVSAAVGLGSIWKFPYEVGTNGGGGFVICYVLGLLLIVLPLMLCELAIGRRGRSDAVNSVANVAAEAKASKWWSMFALLGVITGALILSFYSVIGGWAIAYLVDAAGHGVRLESASSAQERFNSLLISPGKLLLYHTTFMAIATVIVARGISKGIERASMWLMPTLVALLVTLAIYASSRGGFWQTWNYLFAFDVSKITPKIALDALGLGFFSIGVGLSIMIAYAAYAQRDIDLKQVAAITLVSDTAISFLAAFAVFPIVFAENLNPAGGPGLVFVALPLAFSHMPMGYAASIAFYLLLFIAAIGSAISFLELATTPLQHALKWSRPAACMTCAVACWGMGLVTVLSFNVWADWFPLAGIPAFGRSTWFEVIDHVTSNILLPVGGLGIAVFIGWKIPRATIAKELGLHQYGAAALYLLLRFLVPAGIAAATITAFF
jgi:NSS family neurotransmitter:Na+ symporter